MKDMSGIEEPIAFRPERSIRSAQGVSPGITRTVCEHMAYNFPIARAGLALARQARLNWLERHQNAFNVGLHLLGIPLAIAGIPMLFVDWYWGVAAIVCGYLLQWIGHRIEGNDVGEFIPVKKMLGMPYVTVAPRENPRAASH